MRKLSPVLLFIILIIPSTYGQGYNREILKNYFSSMNVVYQDKNHLDNKNVILPNGEIVGDLDFLVGLKGKEYSYCVKKGYAIKSKKHKMKSGHNIFIPVCVTDDGNEKYLFELLLEDGDYQDLFGSTGAPPAPPDPDSIYLPPEPNPVFPEDMDSDDGMDWTTLIGFNPVRNQNSPDCIGDGCGSCFAFAAVAVAEVMYSLALELTDCVSFSEASLAFCGGECPDDYPNIDGCTGITQGPTTNIQVMEMLTEKGVLSASKYPYSLPAMPCQTSYWSDSDNGRTVFNGFSQINNDYESIISALEDGPLYSTIRTDVPISVGMWGDYPMGSLTIDGGVNDGEILLDADYDCSITDSYNLAYLHAVAIVGWGYCDNNGLYYKIRNSYGTDCPTTTSHDNPINTWPGYRFITANSFGLRCLPIYSLFYEKRSIYQDMNNSLLFSLDGAPASGNVSWHIVTNDEQKYDMSSLNGNGPNVLIDLADGVEILGEDKIVFTISYPGGCLPGFDETIEKDLYLELPSPPGIQTLSDPCASFWVYEATDIDPSVDDDDIEWLGLNGVEVSPHQDKRFCDVSAANPEGTLICKVSNDIGSTETEITVYLLWCPMMMVYPNPGDDVINIEVDEIEEDSNIESSLYNSKGEKRKVKNTKIKNHSINVSDLPTGTYYLKVKVKNKAGKNVILEETVVII